MTDALGRGSISRRFRLAALAAVFACGLLAGGASTASAQTGAEVTDLTKRIAVTGEAKNGKLFRGTYTIRKFVARGDRVLAVGKLRGKLKNRRVVRPGVRIRVSDFAAAPTGAQSSQLACRVLTLTLGPLDLNLLGLRVQLNQVNLRITAIPGGGLLGDLLCSLTNLLNPAGLLGNQLAAVLNSLLALVPTSPTGGGAAAGR